MNNDQKLNIRRKPTKFELLFALGSVFLMIIGGWIYCVELGHTMDEYTDKLMYVTAGVAIYIIWKSVKNR